MDATLRFDWDDRRNDFQLNAHKKNREKKSMEGEKDRSVVDSVSRINQKVEDHITSFSFLTPNEEKNPPITIVLPQDRSEPHAARKT